MSELKIDIKCFGIKTSKGAAGYVYLHNEAILLAGLVWPGLVGSGLVWPWYMHHHLLRLLIVQEMCVWPLGHCKLIWDFASICFAFLPRTQCRHTWYLANWVAGYLLLHWSTGQLVGRLPAFITITLGQQWRAFGYNLCSRAGLSGLSGHFKCCQSPTDIWYIGRGVTRQLQHADSFVTGVLAYFPLDFWVGFGCHSALFKHVWVRGLGQAQPFKFGQHVPDSSTHCLPFKAIATILVLAAKTVYLLLLLADYVGH